jgi:hypothetical protein
VTSDLEREREREVEPKKYMFCNVFGFLMANSSLRHAHQPMGLFSLIVNSLKSVH